MSKQLQNEVKRLSNIVHATEELSLKETPMLSADGEEIKLNSILYRGSWSGGYGYRKQGEFKIEALRVIHVNNSARQFRTRCMKGCESIHKIADGCSTEPLYGTMAGIKSRIFAKIAGDLSSCDAKIKSVKDTAEHIKAQQKELVALKDVKLPKVVKS